MCRWRGSSVRRCMVGGWGGGWRMRGWSHEPAMAQGHAGQRPGGGLERPAPRGHLQLPQRSMKFRTRLLLISGLAVAGAAALVTGAVSVSARRAFERADQTRRDALLEQFQRELDKQGQDV